MLKSSLRSVQDAWIGVLLLDFRNNFFKPESQHTLDWKRRDYRLAVAACRATMVDDAEAMLDAWRKNDNGSVEGSSAFLPIMLTATASITMPPDVSTLVGIPYELTTVLPNDPQNRAVLLRAIPRSIRAQIAFFSTNPDDTGSVADQFCAYMTDDAKRRFMVGYEMGAGIIEQWPMTIVENMLMPDNVPLEAKNLFCTTVDVTMVGLVPQVKGLVDDEGNPIDGAEWPVVIQADLHENAETTRVNADPVTKEITIERLP